MTSFFDVIVIVCARAHDCVCVWGGGCTHVCVCVHACERACVCVRALVCMCIRLYRSGRGSGGVYMPGSVPVSMPCESMWITVLHPNEWDYHSIEKDREKERAKKRRRKRRRKIYSVVVSCLTRR